jgi:hypothetical protein
MQINSTRLQPMRQTASQAPPKANESTTFLNEPHVPMDAVMRGFSDFNTDSTKTVLGFTAMGAIGGAVGGLTGGSGWMIPASIGASAVIDSAGSYLANRNDHLAPLAAIGGGIAGATAGAIGGTLGLGLSALTGMNPVVSGAVAGGATHLVMSVLSENNII